MTTQPARPGPSRTMESALPIPRNNSAAEDSSGSAEGRVRRKFQRTASNNDNKVRRPSTGYTNPTSAPRPPPPADSSSSNRTTALRGRRLSVRDQHKVPLGPRPLDMSKQRVTSSDVHASAASSAPRSFLPTSTATSTSTSTSAFASTVDGAAPFANSNSNSNPNFNPHSIPHSRPTKNSNPRFSFGKRSDSSKDLTDSSGSYDFLPAVNFDDFHASISTYEPALSDFPAPGGGGTALFDTSNSSTATASTLQPATKLAMEPSPNSFSPGTGTQQRPPRSASLVRQFSQSRKPSNPTSAMASADPPSMPPPATNMPFRSRRLSQVPAQAPPNPAARAPRKSVGPGMPPTGLGLESRETRHDIPRLSTDSNLHTRLGRTPSLSANRRPTMSTSSTTATDAPRVPNAARSAKTKSLHAPPRQHNAFLNSSSLTPDQATGPSFAHARSPGKPSTHRTHTPSSSTSKRQSMMHHVSGLGARTISPTDARRMKRLSMNPNPPGGPRSPPTPQAEFSFDERALEQSPALIFRKSVTPSSARGTPDNNQNRKSYASGISLSSNSSINSLRLGNTSLQPRMPALSASRLPTPKPRNVHSSAGAEEEEVPPVPAIPKAYESPKDPEHTHFSFATSSRKPSTPSTNDESAVNQLAATELRHIEGLGIDAGKVEAAAPQNNTPQNNKATIRHRRGLTVGSGSADVDKTPATPHTSKKGLQPLRLPPLNLLPLDTPFNNRISSFPLPSAEGDDRHATPPPKRSVKTPSTPMTASKASFFSKGSESEQYGATKHLRSSSSAFNLRAADVSLYGASAMPIASLNPARQTTTPFASNSLPKGSGEFNRLYSRPSGEYKLSDTDVELQSMKVNGPRAPSKKEVPSSQNVSSAEVATPTPGSSLRRKLSLGGWRRSSSKAASHPVHASNSQNVTPKHDEQPPQPPKHNDMPPPKLPASATWSGTLGSSSPTPGSRTRPSLDFGRRKTSTTAVASDTEAEKQQGHRQTGVATARNPSGLTDQTGPPASKSTSILTPMQRMLGSKSSSNVLRARNLDPNLDRDDLVADEEMRKLASKRKDFEHAARDVDDLRKRARPQERVSAAQALQMVNLNIFERGEIIDYKEIYFCGTKTAKKHVGDLNQQTLNFGYDDERGDYNIVLGDHLAYRYEVVDVLGKGSFGQVVRCVDHKTGLLVAIKIIRNKKRFHQQALVEVNILTKLREWDPDNKHSMINFTQSFYFRGHLCISTELLGMNLYEFIKAHEFKGFSLKLIRRFCKQMLASLVLLKSRRVIHCDLKPENILLAHPLHSEIKVIDFGSSCFENEKVYTYIQSRFYRSPEVILGMSYGLPIDMWSLGCILAELLTGYPIFPGENEQEQLACIMEIFGPPEKHLIEKSSRKKLFFDSLGKPRVTVSTKGRRRRPSSKTLQQALKCDDDAFLDFIARCLRWDPERRMKPDEAMLHEFITGVRKSTRSRPLMNGTGAAPSPAKRLPSGTAPASQQRARPLPEPPATSFKHGMAGNTREVPSSSPVKGPRRHSTVQGAPAQGISGVKRAANGAPLNSTSGLPRVAQRSVSGKPDLASAAAIASLKSR